MLTLFFLLKEGARLAQWIVAVLPLQSDDGNRLVAEFRDVTRAVFVATVVTAFVQTLVSAIGYWIVGISYMPIALLLTFIAALVPVIGAAVVVVVIGVFVWLYGEPGYGIFLIVWGVVPVGVIDNFVKPMLAKGKMDLPAPVVLFAMLGGVAVFGPLGVVAGPLIVAFFLAALRLLQRKGVVPTVGEDAGALGHG
jgi:predicted PurR-regulated permease PerM